MIKFNKTKILILKDNLFLINYNRLKRLNKMKIKIQSKPNLINWIDFIIYYFFLFLNNIFI